MQLGRHIVQSVDDDHADNETPVLDLNHRLIHQSQSNMKAIEEGKDASEGRTIFDPSTDFELNYNDGDQKNPLV